MRELLKQRRTRAHGRALARLDADAPPPSLGGGRSGPDRRTPLALRPARVSRNYRHGSSYHPLIRPEHPVRPAPGWWRRATAGDDPLPTPLGCLVPPCLAPTELWDRVRALDEDAPTSTPAEPSPTPDQPTSEPLPTTPEPTGPGDALENNYDAQHAAIIAVDTAYALDFVCPVTWAGACEGGDHDYLRVPLKADTAYLIATYDISGTDTVLDLYWQDSEQPVLSNDDRYGQDIDRGIAGGVASALRFRAPADGWATLRISPRFGAAAPSGQPGTYTVAVAREDSELAQTIERTLAAQAGIPPTPTALPPTTVPAPAAPAPQPAPRRNPSARAPARACGSPTGRACAHAAADRGCHGRPRARAERDPAADRARRRHRAAHGAARHHGAAQGPGQRDLGPRRGGQRHRAGLDRQPAARAPRHRCQASTAAAADAGRDAVPPAGGPDGVPPTLIGPRRARRRSAAGGAGRDCA